MRLIGWLLLFGALMRGVDGVRDWAAGESPVGCLIAATFLVAGVLFLRSKPPGRKEAPTEAGTE